MLLENKPIHSAAACFVDDAMEITVTRLDVGPETVRSLAASLSDAERQRAKRFALDRDCRRFMVARGRLRELLATRLGVRPEAVELMYGRRGKPALAPHFADSGWRFNVSHSGEMAVYAFARGREIGVDIEAVRTLRDSDSIAARFFSRRENAAYQALPPAEKDVGFFNCWTRKEAFIKALGDGLYHPLDRFDVSLAPGEPTRILRVEGMPGDECGWRLESFLPAAGYVGAVVTETNPPQLPSRQQCA